MKLLVWHEPDGKVGFEVDDHAGITGIRHRETGLDPKDVSAAMAQEVGKWEEGRRAVYAARRLAKSGA